LCLGSGDEGAWYFKKKAHEDRVMELASSAAPPPWQRLVNNAKQGLGYRWETARTKVNTRSTTGGDPGTEEAAHSDKRRKRDTGTAHTPDVHADNTYNQEHPKTINVDNTTHTLYHPHQRETQRRLHDRKQIGHLHTASSNYE